MWSVNTCTEKIRIGKHTHTHTKKKKNEGGRDGNKEHLGQKLF